MNSEGESGRALIVTESYWGNTAALAEAVALALRGSGVEVTLVAAANAPDVVGADVSLLLVGAPTHNMSLPSPASRLIAAGRGVPADGPGVGEWIERVRVDGSPRVHSFDTHSSRFSGSAARTIAKRLQKRGIAVAGTEGFLITAEPPVLRAGELERAAAWGSRLAAEVR